MFCKNCGTKMDNDAKFCPSCGQPQKQQNYTAPRPFEKNSVDESQNYQYQKSTFKGKQVSTGTSGSISFGNGKKKKGLFGRLIKLVIIVGIIVVAASFLFGGDPVHDIAFATSVDADYNPVDPLDTFPVSTTSIYVTYTAEGIGIGSTLHAKWYYDDGTEEGSLFADQTIDISYDEQVGYFYVTDTNGWDVGDYTVQFEVDGEIVGTGTFSVE